MPCCKLCACVANGQTSIAPGGGGGGREGTSPVDGGSGTALRPNKQALAQSCSPKPDARSAVIVAQTAALSFIAARHRANNFMFLQLGDGGVQIIRLGAKSIGFVQLRAKSAVLVTSKTMSVIFVQIRAKVGAAVQILSVHSMFVQIRAKSGIVAQH